MADGIINLIKPFIIEKLKDELINNKGKIELVEQKFDHIIDGVRTLINSNITLFNTAIAAMNIFGDAKKTLKESIEKIDFSVLETIPELSNNLPEVKELLSKFKIKLVDFINELIPEKGSAPAAIKKPEAPAAAVPAESPAAVVQEEQDKLKQNEGSIEEGLSNMPNDDKKETIDKIMKMLEDTGILDEIKKRICTAPPAPPAVAAPLPPTPPAGGSNKKHRRKTKKNIRRQKRTYTKFGRGF
jgi:hypothetical protein